MKKRYFLAPLLGILCVFLIFALIACSKDEEDGEKSLEEGWVRDQYGYARPATCWLTETLILAEKPLSEAEMFGEGGESGLASEKALAMDGQSSGSNTYWLVCLFYGTPNNARYEDDRSKIETDFNFYLVQDTRILYESQCVSIREPEISGDLKIDDFHVYASGFFTIDLEYESIGENNEIQGMLTLPFSVTNADAADELYVEASLCEYMKHSMDYDDNLQSLSDRYKENFRMDTQEKLCFGKNANGIEAKISDVSIHYLTEKSYVAGNLSESALMDKVVFENGEPCYMLLDFAVTAMADNDGTHTICVTAYNSAYDNMMTRIEDAPTEKIQEILFVSSDESYENGWDGGNTMHRAIYALPTAKDEVKRVRMIFSLRPNRGLTSLIQTVRFFFGGDLSTNATGACYLEETIGSVPANKDGIYYKLSKDAKSVKAFVADSSFDTVVIPSKLGTGLPVTQIGKCTNSFAKTIIIPSSIISIDKGAFSGCDSLTSIVIAEDNAVYHSVGACIIETASKILISGCKNSVIPDDGRVTAIGKSAFKGCSSLTSITVPGSVTSIGDSAFEGCSGLASITIPDSVTCIGQYAFYGCSGLTSITIPDSVTSIGDFVFNGCSGLTGITIPRSVISIGRRAFYGCSSFTSITVPDSVKSIGAGAFAACSGLTSITLPFVGATLNGTGDGFDSEIRFNYILSTEMDNLTLASLTTVVITGGSVIGERAFEYCRNLISITLPESLIAIGEYAVSGCSGLESITIPSGVTSIGEATFWNCSRLTSITLPDGITSIGDAAFSNCSRLKSITIPGSVTSIGARAFSGCSSLVRVTFENTEGWKCYSSSATTIGTSISANQLAVPAGAAAYLSEEYCKYYWKRV